MHHCRTPSIKIYTHTLDTNTHMLINPCQIKGLPLWCRSPSKSTQAHLHLRTHLTPTYGHLHKHPCTCEQCAVRIWKAALYFKCIWVVLTPEWSKIGQMHCVYCHKEFCIMVMNNATTHWAEVVTFDLHSSVFGSRHKSSIRLSHENILHFHLPSFSLNCFWLL